MSLSDIHTGDDGTNIDITVVDGGVPVVLDPGDGVVYVFKRPDATILQVTGSVVDGPNGLVRYTTTSGDMDQEGHWTLQLNLSIISQSWIGSSNEIDFIVRANLVDVPFAAPNAPTNLSGSAPNYFTANIAWLAPVGGESVAGYNILRSLTLGGPYSLIASTTVTSYQDATLTSSTTYYYVVRSFNIIGESPDSNELTVVTPLVTTPDKVLNVFASAITSTSMSVGWDAVTNDPGLTHYIVTYTNGGINTVNVSVPTTSVNLFGLLVNTTYTITVKAVNQESVEGADSDPINPITLDLASNPVTDLVGDENPTGFADLVWTAPPVDGTHGAADTYSVERRVGQTPDPFLPVANTVDVIYNEARPDGFWDYRIIAQNSGGNAVPGNEVEVKVGILFIPNPATNLIGVQNPTGTAELSWDASVVDATHDPASAYSVQRRDGGTADAFIEVANVAGLTATDVPGIGNFDYQILAQNIIGDATSPSNIVNVAITSFKSVWRTSNVGPSNSDQVQLPLIASGVYNFTIDWGDGSGEENITVWNESATLHTFSGGAGDYSLEMAGVIEGFQFAGGGDKDKLIDVTDWSSLKLTSIGSFQGCSNLVGTATDSITPGTPNLSSTFQDNSALTGGLGSWNVADVTTFNFFFQNDAAFNENISGWTVSSGTSFQSMFLGCSLFNQPVNTWNITSAALSFDQMFRNCVAFNQIDFTGWDVSNATGLGSMFKGATLFNGDFTGWDTSSVTVFVSMFEDAPAFTGIGVEGFVFTSASTLSLMFSGCTVFNRDISVWSMSGITNVSNMLANCIAFNQPIGTWGITTINITDWSSLLTGCTIFNQPVDTWDVSNALDMSGIFKNCIAFDQPLPSWSVANVTDLDGAFSGCVAFNQDLNGWITTSLTSAIDTFNGCTIFNSNLGNWNMSSVTSIDRMLKDCIAFDQNIGAWTISLLTSAVNFLDGSELSTSNYDELLINWAAQTPSLQNNVVFDGGNSTYSSAAVSARDTVLGGTHSWTITDGGLVLLGPQLKTTWKTDNTGPSNNDEITLPLMSTGNYNFEIDWGDGSPFEVITVWDAPATTHVFLGGAGTYNVSMAGTIDGFRFANLGDREKIIDITDWGPVILRGTGSFQGCNKLTSITATGGPTFFGTDALRSSFQECPLFSSGGIEDWVTTGQASLQSAFQGGTNFNADISGWDTSSVTTMSSTFVSCPSFNQSIDLWDVSQVTTFANCFLFDTLFNQPVNSWTLKNTGTVSLQSMFQSSAFDQPLNNWDVSRVTTCLSMFVSTPFNQNISTWTLTNCNSLSGMFQNTTAFNQPLDAWGANVSNVTTMQNMFNNNTVFNQPLNSWVTSSLTSCNSVFSGTSSFNQPLSNWDTSNVTTTASMFISATSFDQDLGAWQIPSLITAQGMFNSIALSTPNYDSLLQGWAGQAPSIQNNVLFGGGNSVYTIATSQASRDILTNAPHLWTVTDNGGV